MSPTEAFSIFRDQFATFERNTTARFDAHDRRVDAIEADVTELTKQVSNLLIEMQLTRKSQDRFTAALATVGTAVVIAAISIILFGGN